MATVMPTDWAAVRHTEQLRFAMTPAELVEAQLWIWHREQSLRKRKGTRRRGDLERAPMKVWRLQRGWTLTDLAIVIRWFGAGTDAVMEMLRRIENGTASKRDKQRCHALVAAAFGVPTDAVLM